MGVNFFVRKKIIPGGEGGPRGGLAKDHKKYVFSFFRHPSLIYKTELALQISYLQEWSQANPLNENKTATATVDSHFTFYFTVF